MRRPRFSAAAPIGIGSLLILGLLAAPGTVRAGIELGEPYPLQGREVMVTVTSSVDLPIAGAEVRAVYRPGSKVSHEEEVGVTDFEGKLRWTPRDAGVVSLSALPQATDLEPEPAAETRNLSVRFEGVPRQGILVMLVAGFILYGGIIRGFRRLEGPMAKLPPDT